MSFWKKLKFLRSLQEMILSSMEFASIVVDIFEVVTCEDVVIGFLVITWDGMCRARDFDLFGWFERKVLSCRFISTSIICTRGLG